MSNENTFSKNQKAFDKEWENIISEIPEIGTENNSNIEHPPTGPRDYIVAEPKQEQYCPLEPNALNSKKTIIKIAWITIILAILSFMILASFFRNSSPIFFGTTLILLVSAITILVINMPHSREPENDGAVL